MKYAIWNNKGGVGKTFLTFALATLTAERFNAKKRGSHHARQVVVIDMCPQANVSEILLGGNGSGSDKLSELIEKDKTVAAYFRQRIQVKPYQPMNNEKSYAIRVSEHNQHIPENLHLISGDPELELQIPTINSLAGQAMPENAWIAVHQWVTNLIEGCQGHLGQDTVFFIDCNPSFSAYTELALVAAERLIVPCSPDGSSARAIFNVARLVYGHNLQTKYKQLRFSAKMDESNAIPPRMHLFVMNRATMYAGDMARAFDAMAQELNEKVQQLHSGSGGIEMFSTQDGNTLFENLDHMPDSHSVGIVMAHTGRPLSAIHPGAIKYNISSAHNINITVGAEQKARYLEALERIVDRLDLGF